MIIVMQPDAGEPKSPPSKPGFARTDSTSTFRAAPSAR